MTHEQVKQYRAELLQDHPGQHIKVADDLGEIIAEIDGHWAVAVIKRSQAHFHSKTKETRTYLKIVDGMNSHPYKSGHAAALFYVGVDDIVCWGPHVEIVTKLSQAAKPLQRRVKDDSDIKCGRVALRRSDYAPRIFGNAVSTSGESEFVEPRGDSVKKLSPENIVEQMNKEADFICEKIEKEIKKLLPPMTTVQAAVQFENGSLLLTGTVAVLAWGGSVALDSLKKELQEQIAPLVRMAVQRVMNRELADRNMLTSVRPMSMNVTPRPLPATLQQRAIAPAAEAAATSSVPGGPVANRPVTTGQFLLLAIATLLIFLIQITLILDRFMTLQWRT